MLLVKTTFHKSVLVSASVEQAGHFFSEPHHSVGDLFPGLESFLPQDQNTYLWSFKKVEFGGFSHQVQVVTRFDWPATHSLTIRPIAGGNAQLSGSIQIHPQSNRTEVSFQFEIEGELPVPRLLKGMIAPKVESELNQLFERYVQRVEQTLNQ